MTPQDIAQPEVRSVGVVQEHDNCEVCDAAVQVAEPVTQTLDSAVQVVSFPFTYGNEPISLPNTKTQDSLAAPLHR